MDSFSTISTWTRKVYRAELGIVNECTYSRATEVEALRGGQAAIERALERQTNVILIPSGLKWCSCCGDERPKAYFDASATAPDGLKWWCRECSNKYEKVRYHTDSDYAARKREAAREHQRQKRGSVRRNNSAYQQVK